MAAVRSVPALSAARGRRSTRSFGGPIRPTARGEVVSFGSCLYRVSATTRSRCPVSMITAQ